MPQTTAASRINNISCQGSYTAYGIYEAIGVCNKKYI